MDGNCFDSLARSFATSSSRRRVLGSLVGAFLAAAFGGTAEARHCRPVGRKCNKDAHCCSGLCKQHLNGNACQCVTAADCPVPCSLGAACADLMACDASLGCMHVACLIDNTIYQLGDRNPANPCQICDPGQNWEDWVNQNDGILCGNPSGTPCVSDFSTCQAGVCVPTPLDDGADCGDGQVCCGGDCCSGGQVCGAGGCQPPPDDGDDDEPPPCPGGDCDSGGCTGTECPPECTINEATFSNGTINPDQDCEWCDTSISTTAWTLRPDNATCGPDSNRFCCNGTCCVLGKRCCGAVGICGADC